jgi:hypothetical protein
MQFEPQSHYEITSHPKTNIEPQRRGGRRDQREKRFIYRADTEKDMQYKSPRAPRKAEDAEGLGKGMREFDTFGVNG